ncbi:MAG TPA: hypothetical protein VJ741_05250 [Solirubrobacteraceae bacterium]|nr:hypothetical protein [Solirubrobacteraceae bacterium]
MYPTSATSPLIAAASGQHFSIGPWIIVPILILAAIVGTIVYVVKDRRKRRSDQPLR